VTGFFDGSAPRAFAHRGWQVGDLAGLENTMAAFRRAVHEGYRYLETDVRATADGQLVVFHDARLDRVTDRRGAIAELPWSEVSRARVGGTEPIPLLADLLEEFPDARFNIDAKSAGAVKPLAKLVTDAGATDRVCLGSFSDQRLSMLREILGDRVAMALGPRAIFRLVRTSALRRRFVTSAVAAQVPLRYQGVQIVTPRFLATAHAAGMEVHVWTIDDPDDMRRLLTLGVDGIMTDRPELLRDVLIERGSWP
jgi:glycerophosphoryl diester phosphodiesterase